MSKNTIFAQKMTKLWTCQISQNKKKHPVFVVILKGAAVSIFLSLTTAIER